MIKKGKYRHYKGGMYEVIGVGCHSENVKEKFVVYKSLYDHPDFKKGQIWVRPIDIFYDKVVIDNKEMERFVYVDEFKI